MWVKSTDIGDKSEMSPKSVSFTLSAHHIAISDKFAAKECAIFLPWKPDGVQFFCLERLRGAIFLPKSEGMQKL